MSAPVTIVRAEIKAGDKIRVDYPSAKAGSINTLAAREFFATHDRDSAWRSSGEVLSLLVRSVVLPTESGHYLDKDGDVWSLRHYVGAKMRCLGVTNDAIDAKDYAPFTRLVPEVVAEDAGRLAKLEQVQADIRPTGACATTNIRRARITLAELIAAEAAA